VAWLLGIAYVVGPIILLMEMHTKSLDEYLSFLILMHARLFPVWCIVFWMIEKMSPPVRRMPMPMTEEERRFRAFKYAMDRWHHRMMQEQTATPHETENKP
jgi:hypothetical protein